MKPESEPPESEADEASNPQIGAEARAKLYRERAETLEAQARTTDLPQHRARLAGAAQRFRELAASEDVLIARKARLLAQDRANS